MRLANQNQTILAHLKEGKTITPIQALNAYGCFRLASRIHELRTEGHNIECKFDSDGEKRWGVYKLIQGDLNAPDHPASH